MEDLNASRFSLAEKECKPGSPRAPRYNSTTRRSRIGEEVASGEASSRLVLVSSQLVQELVTVFKIVKQVVF